MEQNRKAVTKAVFDSQIHLGTRGRSKKSTNYLLVGEVIKKALLAMLSYHMTI